MILMKKNFEFRLIMLIKWLLSLFLLIVLAMIIYIIIILLIVSNTFLLSNITDIKFVEYAVIARLYYEFGYLFESIRLKVGI